MSDCVFCRIVSGEIPAKVVGRTEEAVAFHDLNPQAPVHVLVVPRQHLSGANASGDRPDVWLGVMRLAVQVAGELGVAERGYRLVVNQGSDGGQSVDHLHVHLLGGRRMHWPPG
jgi:histidine triad (HIT) family protein